MDIKKDCQFFTGKIIEQVCFGLYQAQIHFNDNIHIEIGHEIEYLQKNGQLQKWGGDNGRDTFCMNNLLEVHVTKAYASMSDTLHLSFENGESIKITSANAPHESYVVHNKSDFEVIGW